LVATNLAREVVEAVRGRRDSNWLAACAVDGTNCHAWNEGLGDTGDYSFVGQLDPTSGSFLLDYTPTTLADCVADQTCLLYVKSATGLYAHQSEDAVKTPYYRFAQVLPVCADVADCGGDGVCDEGQSCTSDMIGLLSRVTVQWAEIQRNDSVVLEDYLYNWR
jgi:hypothetical protein